MIAGCFLPGEENVPLIYDAALFHGSVVFWLLWVIDPTGSPDRQRTVKKIIEDA